MMNLCIHCAHYKHIPTSHTYGTPAKHECDAMQDVVTGEDTIQDCRRMREKFGACGVEGKLWEPKNGTASDPGGSECAGGSRSVIGDAGSVAGQPAAPESSS